MSDQSKLGLGRIITTPQQRDAIHIAVAPVVAARIMKPGEHVGLNAEGLAIYSTEPIGLVDPFLKSPVAAGDKFWLFLYPGTITGLRHEWAHPAFGPEEKAICDKADSEAWVRRYAQEHCFYDGDNAYDVFMERVREGDIFYHGDDLHSMGDCEDRDELFRHLEILLGKRLSPDEFNYTCSC